MGLSSHPKLSNLLPFWMGCSQRYHDVSSQWFDWYQCSCPAKFPSMLTPFLTIYIYNIYMCVYVVITVPTSQLQCTRVSPEAPWFFWSSPSQVLSALWTTTVTGLAVQLCLLVTNGYFFIAEVAISRTFRLEPSHWWMLGRLGCEKEAILFCEGEMDDRILFPFSYWKMVIVGCYVELTVW